MFKQPLESIKIIDFSRVLAGPYCTLLLADMGAEVIKIENPNGGDDTRFFGPYQNGESGYFSLLNRGKQSVTADLKNESDLQMIKDMISEILKVVIKDGKGIEVNTSYHRYGLKDMTPSRDILKLYKELGGTIITIGSDSHKKEHLGAYIDEAKDELRKLGFKYYCTFENMAPIYHEL